MVLATRNRSQGRLRASPLLPQQKVAIMGNHNSMVKYIFSAFIVMAVVVITTMAVLPHTNDTIQIAPKVSAVPVAPVETVQIPFKQLFHPDNLTENQIECLALNVYHEAKNQSLRGQIAVAMVTMNRVVSKQFPNNICDVVKQAKTLNGSPIRNKCQFSFYCDGKSDVPRDVEAWLIAQEIAKGVLYNWLDQEDMTMGAMWYHADYVDPWWNKAFVQVASIGNHIFYVD